MSVKMAVKSHVQLEVDFRRNRQKASVTVVIVRTQHLYLALTPSRFPDYVI